MLGLLAPLRLLAVQLGLAELHALLLPSAQDPVTEDRAPPQEMAVQLQAAPVRLNGLAARAAPAVLALMALAAAAEEQLDQIAQAQPATGEAVAEPPRLPAAEEAAETAAAQAEPLPRILLAQMAEIIPGEPGDVPEEAVEAALMAAAVAVVMDQVSPAPPG
jgi:hypothetical protein